MLESLNLLAKHDIPFDLVGIHTNHMETALKLAEKIPNLRMVFDHLNQPPIQKSERFGRWGELMKVAAQHENFELKISGMGTTSGKGPEWTAEDVKPYIDYALDCFGLDRCFCGGDWPVALLAGSYAQVWQNYECVLKDLLNEQEIEQIAYNNAVDFYKLTPNI